MFLFNSSESEIRKQHVNVIITRKKPYFAKFLELIFILPFSLSYDTIIHVNLKIVLIGYLPTENDCHKVKLLSTHLSIMSGTPMKKEGILKIYVDGAARSNPGPAASAFLLVRDGKVIHDECVYIGTATNNTAEYRAIINALKTAKQFSQRQLEVYSDSNLAVKQINKEWKINYPHLSKLFNQVQKLRKDYERVKFFHVGRGNPYIQKCDKLCNERLDAEGFQ